MRIAVYGDSYAEKRHSPDSGAWWRVLESMGHEVTCFAESSSSLIWSARILEKHATKFDFNIWCTTAIGRYSTRLTDGTWFHLSSGVLVDDLLRQEQDKEKIFKLQIFSQFIDHFYNVEDDDLISRSLVESFLIRFDNLMIVPGFNIPDITDFHLSDISAIEENHLFPEYVNSTRSIHKDYRDARVCHMSKQNNRILAELIDSNLRRGIFKTDISNFQLPTENLFEKKL